MVEMGGWNVPGQNLVGEEIEWGGLQMRCPVSEAQSLLVGFHCESAGDGKENGGG